MILKKNWGFWIEAIRVFTGSQKKIETDYRYLYTEHNYAFYRVEIDVVKIIDILHEREDFMQTLFGITTLTDDSDEYE